MPSSDSGIEIQVRLTSSSSTTDLPSYSFAVESVNNEGDWIVHSNGSCAVQTKESDPPTKVHPINFDALTQRHSCKTWNEAFQRVGFEYGRQFGALDKIHTHGKYESQAAGKIPIFTKSGLMKDESRYFLHPAAVDSLLQLIIIAIHGGNYQDMPWGVIPVRFDEVTIRQVGESEDTIGDAVAWLPEGQTDRSRQFLSDGKIFGAAGEVLLDIKGLHTLAYEAALPPKNEAALPLMPYAGISWKPDVEHVDLSKAFSSANNTQAVSALLSLVEWANHKQPLKSLLLVDQQGDVSKYDILQTTSLATTVSVVSKTEDEGDARLIRLSVPEDKFALEAVDLDAQDLVILGPKESAQLVEPESASLLKKHLGKDSHAMLILEQVHADKVSQVLKETRLKNTVVSFADKTLV